MGPFPHLGGRLGWGAHIGQQTKLDQALAIYLEQPNLTMAKPKIMLAYSGGLDTTVAVPWLQEKYDADIVTLTVDLGMVDLESIRQRALSIGAVEALTVDGKDTLVDEFLFPSLQAGTIYEEQYPLATALGRPLIARYLVEAAREHDAYAIAHGCTGKGNDQVRLEVGIAALGPDIAVIAPIRDWGMSREDEIEYGQARNLPVNANRSRFSTDENLWGRSVEAGELEDPWLEPPEDAYAWTSPVDGTPAEPAYLEIHFECGVPTAVDGESMTGTDLISYLNTLAGQHGVGRIDHVENRLVGIKSREIYECPAATVLHAAHASLETMTLTKDQARTKARIAQEYADVVYNGLWFTAHRADLNAYVQSTQRFVTGEIRVRLHKGTCTVVGRQADKALYSYGLATYDRADEFDHSSAEGFIKIYGLSVRTENQVQSD